jgi:hypothetical protein
MENIPIIIAFIIHNLSLIINLVTFPNPAERGRQFKKSNWALGN